MNDLQLAYNCLVGKQIHYTQLWNYYRGQQPMVYTAARLNTIFKQLDAYFAENWCVVVVDAVKERIELEKLLIEDKTQQAAMDTIWEENELGLEADEIHTAALVCGESFLIVWPADDGTPQAFYNDPRLCHVIYEADNPRQARLAAKWWISDDGKRRLTLYYPDRLEYYVSVGPAENVQGAASFIPLPDEPMATNPYGLIPVFHFRTQHDIQSDLQNVIPIQNAINKLITDMMVAAEYQALPQRYIISGAGIQGQVKNAPNEILDLPAAESGEQNTEAGQFSAADLQQFFESIDNLVNGISAITRTPHHYFFSAGGVPSGEALIVMESGLNKKTKDRINRFTPTWKHAGAFLLQLAGMTVKPQAITPEFEEVATVQPLSTATIAKIERETAVLDSQLGASQQTILTALGYDAELEAQQSEAEGGSVAETILTAFERGDAGNA